MISVVEIYQDVARDNVNQSENGDLSYAMFNRISKRAELRLIDFLTGDVSGRIPPEPYLTQKNKDWLHPFLKKKSGAFVSGSFRIPDDYYTFDNMYLVDAGSIPCDDDDGVADQQCNTPIEILDGSQFNYRCKTYIKELRPSYKKPVAKIIDGGFEAMPKDLGVATIEYIRYPNFAFIVSQFNPVFNDEEPNPTASRNYEWPEYARDLLVWFITDTFSIHTREGALKKANMETGKSTRG